MYKKDFEHFNQIFFLTNKKKNEKKIQIWTSDFMGRNKRCNNVYKDSK